MKATGIIRKLDQLGRIVLPKELRDTLEMPDNTPIEIFVDGDKIILKKYAPGCTFCDGLDDITLFCGKYVCSACKSDIRKGIQVR